MKKLLKKSFLLLLPLIVLIAFFVIDDPMKMIHKINDPTSKGVLMNDRLFLTHHLESNKGNYDSFIFGSSRSKALKTNYWKKYIGPNTSVYHMGVNDETLFGLEKKIAYLNQQEFKLKNAVIFLDHRLLSLSKNPQAHIFREHYKMTNENAASYYQKFFIAFTQPKFLRKYIKYKMTDEIDDSENLLWDPGFSFNEKSGDIFYTRMDGELEKDSVRFYQSQDYLFEGRKETILEPIIDAHRLDLLLKIKSVLDSHKTKYKVIITPNFDMKKLDKADVDALRRLFGKQFFDFSGENTITSEIGNFYEHKHFKPFIANQILAESYNAKK